MSGMPLTTGSVAAAVMRAGTPKRLLQEHDVPNILGMILADRYDDLLKNFNNHDFSMLTNLAGKFGAKNKSIILLARTNLPNPQRMLSALIKLGVRVTTDDLRYDVFTTKLNREDIIHIFLQALVKQKTLIDQDIVDFVRVEYERGIGQRNRKAGYEKDYLREIYLQFENHNRSLNDQTLLEIDGSNGYDVSPGLEPQPAAVSSSSSRPAKAGRVTFSDEDNSEEELALTETKPQPQLGNLIVVWWRGERRNFKGYVVEKNPENTEIKVIYEDGDCIWEKTEGLQYKLLRHRPLADINLKDDTEKSTYFIFENNGNVIKSLNAVTTSSSAPAASTTAATTSSTSPRLVRKKLKPADSTTTSAASATPRPISADSKRSTPSEDSTVVDPKVKRRKLPKGYKQANAAELPEFQGPMLYSAAGVANAEPPAKRARDMIIDLSGSDDEETKLLQSTSQEIALQFAALEAEKAALAKKQAEIESRKQEMETKIKARREEISTRNQKVITQQATEIDRSLRAAVGDIEAAAAAIATAVEGIDKLRESGAVLNVATKELMLSKLQDVVGNFATLGQVGYASRTLLPQAADRLQSSLQTLQTTLTGSAPAAASSSSSSASKLAL